MIKKPKVVISVIGGHYIDDKVEYMAHEIGKIVAKVGAVIVCGCQPLCRDRFGEIEAARSET